MPILCLWLTTNQVVSQLRSGYALSEALERVPDEPLRGYLLKDALELPESSSPITDSNDLEYDQDTTVLNELVATDLPPLNKTKTKTKRKQNATAILLNTASGKTKPVTQLRMNEAAASTEKSKGHTLILMIIGAVLVFLFGGVASVLVYLILSGRAQPAQPATKSVCHNCLEIKRSNLLRGEGAISSVLGAKDWQSDAVHPSQQKTEIAAEASPLSLVFGPSDTPSSPFSNVVCASLK